MCKLPYDYIQDDLEYLMKEVFDTAAISKRLADFVDEERCEKCKALSHDNDCNNRMF